MSGFCSAIGNTIALPASEKGSEPKEVLDVEAPTRFFARWEVTVFYDGWCPFCTQSVNTARRLDWLRLLKFVSFREPGVPERFGLDPDRLEQRLHSTGDGKTFHEGIDGILQMVTRLPLLWPAVPFLFLSRWLGFGQRVYDWIAARRTILPTGGCDEHCSIEDPKKSS